MSIFYFTSPLLCSSRAIYIIYNRFQNFFRRILEVLRVNWRSLTPRTLLRCHSEEMNIINILFPRLKIKPSIFHGNSHTLVSLRHDCNWDVLRQHVTLIISGSKTKCHYEEIIDNRFLFPTLFYVGNLKKKHYYFIYSNNYLWCAKSYFAHSDANFIPNYTKIVNFTYAKCFCFGMS